MYKVLDTNTANLIGEFKDFDTAKEVMDNHFPSEIVKDGVSQPRL